MKKKLLLLPTLSSLLFSTAILTQTAYAEEVATDSVVATGATRPEEEVVTTTDAPEAAAEPTEVATTTEETSGEEAVLTTAAIAEEPTADDTITILHTNDMHGRIEEGSGVIGMAKLATVVEESRAQGTTIVLDAGDPFQGMPISNSSKGEDMATLMNAVGYDAMAVGNHEFDFGFDQAMKYKEILNFPILSANTYVNGVRAFEAYTEIDKTPDVTGDEIIVIGVTTPETSTKTHPNNIVGVIFTEPIDEVKAVISEIEAKAAAEGKEYKTYIVLGHLGIDPTTKEEWQGSTMAQALSKFPELEGKKVIVIDGHSHTVESATYGNVTYNQTGSYLNNVGKITLNSEQVLSAGVIEAAEAKALEVNEAIATKVQEIANKFAEANAVVLRDNNPVELNGDRMNVRVRETNLGNAVTDALYAYAQTGFAHKADLAVTNGGGLRDTIKADQPITVGDTIAVLPFGNIISQIEVTGQQIEDMYKFALSAALQTDADGNPVLDENGNPLLGANGGFLHTSGARVYYDTNLEPENRLISVEIYNKETGEYDALDLTKTYYLATNDFVAAGGDGYTMLGGAREEGVSLDEVFADYLKTADLEQYAEINPSTRLISIDSSKDTDGDGYADYIEVIAGTEWANADDFPGKKEAAQGDVVAGTTVTTSTSGTVAKATEQPTRLSRVEKHSLPNTGDASSILGFLGTGLIGLAGAFRRRRN